MPETINLRHGNDCYYTLTETTETIEGGVRKGTAIITGRCKHLFKPGDIIEIFDKYIVEEELERRDCRGEFPNPQDAKNSFFKVRCKFERFIESSTPARTERRRRVSARS